VDVARDGCQSSKVLDLENWIFDGSFVCTSNAEMAGQAGFTAVDRGYAFADDTSWR